MYFIKCDLRARLTPYTNTCIIRLDCVLLLYKSVVYVNTCTVKTCLNQTPLGSASLCARNRQVFCLYRLNKVRFSTMGLYLRFSICRILVYWGSDLDRFHCIVKAKLLWKQDQEFQSKTHSNIFNLIAKQDLLSYICISCFK